MKSIPTVLRISRARLGFTLVELMVAIAVFSLVAMAAFSVLHSGLWLSSENLGINVSSLFGRKMVDQIGQSFRYALTEPTLINSTGAAVTGTSADGILIKNLIGSPYVVKESGGTMGDIAATATQFDLEFNPSLPAPSVGDFVLMESISRPELEISAVSTLSPVGTTQRRLITTTTAIGEVAQPSNYRVTGQLYRKEAYVFVNTDTTSNPFADLRHYYRVKGSTNFATASNYYVMGSSYQRLNSQLYFTIATSNNAQTIVLNALASSSTTMQKIARNNAVSTFTTVPIQLRLWSINQ